MGAALGGILAIANGALQGSLAARDATRERTRRAELDALHELQAAAQLGNTPGVRFAPPAPTAPAPVTSPKPAPAGDGAPPTVPIGDEPHAGLTSPGADIGGARGPAGGRTAAGLTRGTGATPAPSAPVIAAAAPTLPPLGRVAGQDVYFDPTQTAAGREEGARARRRAAFDTLHAERPGEYGAFVDGEDYEQRAAEESQHAFLLQAFKGARNGDGSRRFSDADAETNARIHAHLGTHAPALAHALAGPRIDPNSAEGVAARVQVAEARADATGRARQKYGTGRSGNARAPVLSAASQALAATRTDKRLDAIAERAVAAAGGDAAKAAALLTQQPETRDVFAQGMNSTHLQAAAQRYQQRTARSSGGTRKEGVADLVARLADQRAQKRAAYDRAAAALRTQGKTDRQIAGTLGERP